jgi:hypothetical protein
MVFFGRQILHFPNLLPWGISFPQSQKRFGLIAVFRFFVAARSLAPAGPRQSRQSPSLLKVGFAENRTDDDEDDPNDYSKHNPFH